MCASEEYLKIMMPFSQSGSELRLEVGAYEQVDSSQHRACPPIIMTKLICMTVLLEKEIKNLEPPAIFHSIPSRFVFLDIWIWYGGLIGRTVH